MLHFSNNEFSKTNYCSFQFKRDGHVKNLNSIYFSILKQFIFYEKLSSSSSQLSSSYKLRYSILMISNDDIF